MRMISNKNPLSEIPTMKPQAEKTAAEATEE